MIYITIKDEDGVLRPKAILEKDDSVGQEIVRKFANITDKIVRVEIKEIEEI